MHETGIAAELWRLCEREGAGRVVRKVRIAVGELSAVDPELLRLAWEVVGSDGGGEAPELEIDYRPARQRCERCGDVPGRQPGSWLRLCPVCGSALWIEGGDELDFVALECA